jgi:dCMP deaminase
MRHVMLAYVPVLHHGYHEFFAKHGPKAEALYIFGPELIAEFDHLQRKDPRALQPEQAKRAIEGLGTIKTVIIASPKDLQIITPDVRLIIPNEDETKEIVARYLPKHKKTVSPIFLRWDKSLSVAQQSLNPDSIISREEFDRTVMRKLIRLSKNTPDWYRQVAAAIVKDGEIVAMAHNTHQPSPHTNYILGSPRGFFKKGINIELTTDSHAEPLVIGYAARKGIALEGASIYVTTFPCPPCAKLIRACGFAKCYFVEGYAMLDGESLLKESGIEIIQVDMSQQKNPA